MFHPPTLLHGHIASLVLQKGSPAHQKILLIYLVPEIIGEQEVFLSFIRFDYKVTLVMWSCVMKIPCQICF